MAEFVVSTYGDTTVRRKLMKMADQAEDLSDAWPEVVEIAARGYDRSFELEGPGWAPLKASTIARKGGDSRIRIRSGRDRATISDPFQLRYRGTRHTVNIMAAGETPAVFHQEGTTRMVARPLKLTRYYQDQMSLVIRAQLSRAYDSG